MPGWLGLQLGHEELRVFAVYILISLLIVIVFVLVFLFWGTLFGTVTMGALERAGIDPEASGFDVAGATQYMGASDWVVVIAAGLAGLAIVTWLSARLVSALISADLSGTPGVARAREYGLWLGLFAAVNY